MKRFRDFVVLTFGIFRITSITSALDNGSNPLCQPWTVDKKQRIFVLTDIANEPDDTMSLIRLLAHSDLYEVEGLVAITSFWLPNATYPNLIQNLVNAYGEVQANLQTHSNLSFPTVESLSSKIGSGPNVYGMQAIKALEAGQNLTAGAKQLIQAVDASSEPLYVQIWGGPNTLATALWYVNRTRSASDLATFTSKLRAYAISDQDDTGVWIRRNFPKMRYIATRAGFNQYSNAAWTGISTLTVDLGGPDNSTVLPGWLAENIQIGLLGKHYPDVVYIMEGDTPSLLYNMPNGLGDPEHPDWGSWGGRYTPNPLDDDAQYGDAADTVVGQNGVTYQSTKASIWRWRSAFQNEFAARMQWTLAPNSPNSNTTHPPIVVVNNSCTSSALEYAVNVGDLVTLDASSSWSPDVKANLNFTWFQYLEPSSYQNSPAVVPTINLTYPAGSTGRVVSFKIPEPMDGDCVAPENVTEFGQFGERQKCPVLHVVLAVQDASAKHPITRYRRILLKVRPYKKPRTR